MVVDGLLDGPVGDIHAVMGLERFQNIQAKLHPVIIQVVFVALHGRVHDGGEKALVLHRVQELKMLLHALHGGAGLRAEESVQVVVAALDGALEDGAGVGTCAVGHVIARHVRGCAARRAQPRRKAAGQVQKRLRDVVAVIAQGQPPVPDGPGDKRILRVLEQVLEEDQMFQILQTCTPLFCMFILSLDRNL